MADALEIKRKWVTSYVAFIAQAASDFAEEMGGALLDRNHMIVLADALEAAGCKSLDVLSALRGRKYALQDVIVERIIAINTGPRAVGKGLSSGARTSPRVGSERAEVSGNE